MGVSGRCEKKTISKKKAFGMKVLSTYFPLSFQEGGAEGSLGELCNDNENSF